MLNQTQKQILDVTIDYHPQNRSTGSPYVGQEPGYVLYEPNGHGKGIAREPEGLLSLTARNDSSTSPVTREDVINYICEKVNGKLQELRNNLSIVDNTIPPHRFSFFARNGLTRQNLINMHSEDVNKFYALTSTLTYYSAIFHNVRMSQMADKYAQTPQRYKQFCDRHKNVNIVSSELRESVQKEFLHYVCLIHTTAINRAIVDDYQTCRNEGVRDT